MSEMRAQHFSLHLLSFLLCEADDQLWEALEDQVCKVLQHTTDGFLADWDSWDHGWSWIFRLVNVQPPKKGLDMFNFQVN